MRDTQELHIQGLGFGAEGWCRDPQGRFISVPHTLPGDRVLARVGEFHRGRAWAQVVAWLERSPQHRDPACAHYDRCSGCALRHVSLEEEARWKLEATRQMLARYGPPGEPPPLAWISTESRLDHRSRGSFRVEVGPQGLTLGLRSTDLEGSLVDVRACPAQSPGWRQRIGAVAAWLEQDLARAQGLEALELRCADQGPDLLILRGELPQERLLAWEGYARGQGLHLAQHGEEGLRPLLGPASVSLHLRQGVVVQAPGTSWTHPNPAAGQLLARWVRGVWRQEHDFFLDLCCGVGTVTMALAPRAKRVLAVDEDRHALEALSGAAQAAGLPQVETRAGRVGAVLRKLRRELVGQPHPTAAVINPMRRPLGAAQLRDLPHLGPRELLYLGPAPASAAKDVSWLCQQGFSVREGAVVNLHPSTARFMLALVLEADGAGM